MSQRACRSSSGIGALIIFAFTFSSYLGMDKGLKIIGNLNAWFYQACLFCFLLPARQYLSSDSAPPESQNGCITSGYGEIDLIDIGGEALTSPLWTLFDLALWVGFARSPVSSWHCSLMEELSVSTWLLTDSSFGVRYHLVLNLGWERNTHADDRGGGPCGSS